MSIDRMQSRGLHLSFHRSRGDGGLSELAQARCQRCALRGCQRRKQGLLMQGMDEAAAQARCAARQLGFAHHLHDFMQSLRRGHGGTELARTGQGALFGTGDSAHVGLFGRAAAACERFAAGLGALRKPCTREQLARAIARAMHAVRPTPADSIHFSALEASAPGPRFRRNRPIRLAWKTAIWALQDLLAARRRLIAAGHERSTT